MGFVGIIPRLAYYLTDDTLATITTPGYLDPYVANGTVIVDDTTMALVQTTTGPVWCAVHIDGTTEAPTYTLSLQVNPSGILPLAEGGTGASLTANAGGIFYSTGSAAGILAGTATAGRLLQSGASTIPNWTTSTYPSTIAANSILYASSANTVAALSPIVNNALLGTGNTGIPSWVTLLPSAVQVPISNIHTTAGTPSSGTFLRGDATWAAPSGSGTVNIGTVNTLAYYPAASTAVNPLPGGTANNAVIITSGTGVPNVATTLPTQVQGNITATGALASGSLATGFTIVTPDLGGTGVSNASGSTITLTGSLATIGNHSLAFTLSGTTSVTLPTTGNLIASSNTVQGGILYGTSSSVPTVTMLAAGTSGQLFTSGGTGAPSWISTVPLTAGGTNASLTASSSAVVYSTASAFALSTPSGSGQVMLSGSSGTPVPTWVSQLPLTAGGTNNSITPAAGGVIYSTSTALNVTAAGTSGYLLQSAGTGAPTWLAMVGLSQGGTNNSITAAAGALVYSTSTTLDVTAVGTSGQLAQSAGAGAPGWTTATYPSTVAANSLLYASATNTLAALTPAVNNGLLGTNGSGVPVFTLTFPSAVEVPIVNIDATGTPDATTFLRGDATWAVPASTGTVNAGTTNVLAYYAADGSTLSPIPSGTFVNGVVITSILGEPEVTTTLPSLVQGHITQTGALTSGSLTTGFSVIDPAQGGTGVDNGSSTLTLGGDLEVSGSFDLTLTVSANTSLALPTEGYLLSTLTVVTNGIPYGTSSIDPVTNMTTAGTAGQLFSSNGSTTPPGWITTVPLANGGTGAAISSPAQGDLFYINSSNVGALLATGTAGAILMSGGASANPAWSSSAYPSTLASGMATWMGTPSATNFWTTLHTQASANVTGTSGSAVVFATSPVLTTPDLGAATAGSIKLTGFGLYDSNGNDLLNVETSVSAVNYFSLTNNSTGSAPIFAAESTADTNVTLFLNGKGNAGASLQGATNAAAAGIVGRVGESYLVTATVAVTGTTAVVVASQAVGKGDWDVDGHVLFYNTSGGSTTNNLALLQAWINTDGTSGPTLPGSAQFFSSTGEPNPGLPAYMPLACPPFKYNSTSDGTIYLMALVNLTGGTATQYATLRVRRER
jgi:hypothetical protein